jgi:hypothetical protein
MKPTIILLLLPALYAAAAPAPTIIQPCEDVDKTFPTREAFNKGAVEFCKYIFGGQLFYNVVPGIHRGFYHLETPEPISIWTPKRPFAFEVGMSDGKLPGQNILLAQCIDAFIHRKKETQQWDPCWMEGENGDKKEMVEIMKDWR